MAPTSRRTPRAISAPARSATPTRRKANAKLHADALDDYPALAGWLRSSIGIDAVRRHFEHSVRGMGERAPAATVETVDRYRRLIAAQLVERPDLDHDVEAAATFAEAVPALRERLAAARKVHVDAEAEAEAAARGEGARRSPRARQATARAG